jgi:hypothetical protein
MGNKPSGEGGQSMFLKFFLPCLPSPFTPVQIPFSQSMSFSKGIQSLPHQNPRPEGVCQLVISLTPLFFSFLLL